MTVTRAIRREPLAASTRTVFGESATLAASRLEFQSRSISGNLGNANARSQH